MPHDDKKCDCFACIAWRVMKEENPKGDDTRRVIRLLPDVIASVCNLPKDNPEKDSQDPRFLSALLIGISLCMDAIGVPTTITQKPLVIKSIIDDAILLIAKAAVASGKGTIIDIETIH